MYHISIGERGLIFVLIALYAIDPFSMGFVSGYLLALFIFLKLTVLLPSLDRTFFALLLFSGVYSIFYAFKPTLGVQFIFIYALIPSAFYLGGRLLYQQNGKEGANTLLLLSLGFLFSLTSMASVFKAILDDGFVTLKRDVPVIWTGNIIPATNMAAAFVMNMCIPGILIIGYAKLKPLWFRILSIMVFVLSITCVMRLGSRTHLGITLFAILIALFYRFKKQSAVKNFGMLALIFVAVNAGFAYLSLDKDADVFAAYADRMDSKTHGVSTAGGRLNKWEKSVEYLFTEPLGWDLDEFGYAHNLWFDTMRVGGMISFILLLIFTYIVSKAIIKLFNLRKKIALLDGQLLIYAICFALVFFVEPILEGYFTLFTLFCFLSGFSKAHIQWVGQAGLHQPSAKGMQNNTFASSTKILPKDN